MRHYTHLALKQRCQIHALLKAAKKNRPQIHTDCCKSEMPVSIALYLWQKYSPEVKE